MKVLYPFFVFANQESCNLLNSSCPIRNDNFLLLKFEFRRSDESSNLLKTGKYGKSF